MNDPVTWADLLNIVKWYVVASVGIWFVALVLSVLWAWWENRS